MSVLIFAFLVILVLVLIWMLVDSAPMGDVRLKWALKAIACVVAILLICQRAGLISG